jgi:multimeric flavodoxin WrbA
LAEAAKMRVFAVNGSPRMGRGSTELVLDAFLSGMTDAGADVERIYAHRIRLKPCACGEMHCWYTTPGACCIRDGMDDVLSKLRFADTLVLATPVYIPLPERMQTFVNRLCPVIEPRLTFVGGRTRGQLRDGYALRRFVAVVTGDWWEPENGDTVVRIVEELAADAGVEFAGALVRPHALLMRNEAGPTQAGQAVLDAARRAGRELAATGCMNPATLAEVSRPLVAEEELRRVYNAWL